MLVLGSYAKPGLGFLLNSTLFYFCVFKFIKKKPTLCNERALVLIPTG